MFYLSMLGFKLKTYQLKGPHVLGDVLYISVYSDVYIGVGVFINITKVVPLQLNGAKLLGSMMQKPCRYYQGINANEWNMWISDCWWDV